MANAFQGSSVDEKTSLSLRLLLVYGKAAYVHRTRRKTFGEKRVGVRSATLPEATPGLGATSFSADGTMSVHVAVKKMTRGKYIQDDSRWHHRVLFFSEYVLCEISIQSCH